MLANPTAISMSSLQGKSAFTLSSGYQGASSWLNVIAGTYYCTYYFYTDGTGTATANKTTIRQTPWGTPTTTGIGSSYYIRCTTNSGFGVMVGLGLNTWYQISQNRAWTVHNHTTSSEDTGTLTFEISKDQSTILSTMTYDYDVGRIF